MVLLAIRKCIEGEYMKKKVVDDHFTEYTARSSKRYRYFLAFKRTKPKKPA